MADENYFNVRLEATLKNGLLKEARLKLDLSQSEAAQQIGISGAHYGLIERMQSYPGGSVQKKICEFYTQSGIPMTQEQVFPEALRSKPFDKRYVLSRKFSDPQLESMVEGQRLLAESIEEKIEQEDMRKTITMVTATLKKKEADVLRRYYGLEPYDDTFTIAEIAKIYNLSTQRISQIKDSALGNLRLKRRSKQLRVYLGR